MKYLLFAFILINLSIMPKMIAQDWANLNRYHNANVLLKAAEKDTVRIVFMGNSITEGWSNLHPDFFDKNPFVNRGISGQTTPQMLIRFKPDVIDLDPNLVIILAGINDIAENTGPTTLKTITDNIQSMVDLALHYKIKVLLCSVLPASNFPWRPDLKPDQKIVELNQNLEKMAIENSVYYVDYFNAMTNGSDGLRSDLGEDGVHPNLKGYAIMEPILLKSIERALSQNQ